MKLFSGPESRSVLASVGHARARIQGERVGRVVASASMPADDAGDGAVRVAVEEGGGTVGAGFANECRRESRRAEGSAAKAAKAEQQVQYTAQQRPRLAIRIGPPVPLVLRAWLARLLDCADHCER